TFGGRGQACDPLLLFRALELGRLRAARVGRLERFLERKRRRRRGAQRGERQAQADGRISHQQIKAAAAEIPALAARSRKRQHESGRRLQPALEDARETLAFLGIAQIGRKRIDVKRERRLFLDEAPRILVRLMYEAWYAQPRGDGFAEPLRLRKERFARAR